MDTRAKHSLNVIMFFVTLGAFSRATSITEFDNTHIVHESCYYYNSSECQASQPSTTTATQLNNNNHDSLIDSDPTKANLSLALKHLPSECLIKQQCHIPNAAHHSGNAAKVTTEILSTELPPACFVVWNNDSSTNYTAVIKNMGCMNITQSLHRDCDKQECVNKAGRQHLFCCCKAQLCNGHFYSNFTGTTDPDEDASPAINEPTDSVMWSVAAVLVFVVITSAIAMVMTRLKKRKRLPDHELARQENYNSQLPAVKEALLEEDVSTEIDIDKIQLEKILATGRFGKVWKANTETCDTHSSVCVAVKIFSPQEMQSWTNECQVYKLPDMEHNNLLKFFCSKRHLDGDGLNCSYWIVTEYHERGSLHDYLKSNVLSYEEMLYIAASIASGMNHLHEEGRVNKDGPSLRKPSIAHRDFKSKNVLLKQDLTPCIADFGLAYIFYQNQPISNNHGQIGTRRYMAPEILEGSIAFTVDSFIRIDMYAVGLVLWEMITRCELPNTQVGPYKLPYEAELGPSPGNDAITHFVAAELRRPKIKSEWLREPGPKKYCETIVECWDNDAEARLSASCVYERMTELRHAGEQRSPLMPESNNIILMSQRPSSNS